MTSASFDGGREPESRPWKRWAGHPQLVEFFSSHRRTVEELYPSERRYLPDLARRSRSVLDVGCAAGGFYEIWRAFAPDIDYAGVDVSAPLVRAATASYPGIPFLVGDCARGLPISGERFDAVAALGWLHWEPRYAQAIEELWRVCRRWLFFDLRLIGGDRDEAGGEQKLDYSGQWDGATTTPYVCAALNPLASLLGGLGPASISAFGYSGTPHQTIGVDHDVVFATFVLERPGAGRPPVEPALDVELPLEWPAREGRLPASPPPAGR